MIRILIVWICIVMSVSCAIQVAPEGGPADASPPVLLKATPENFSTNFSEKDIRLDFDEYVALNQITEQLVVSPLLTYTPETQIRRKSLLIHLRDTLLPNTTYTMNFGLGIIDNNEGNKLENFQYVFSTGSTIDSLSVSGRVFNADDQSRGKGTLVMLYKEKIDSLPYRLRPLYFSRTKDSGDYQVKNISPGEYTIIALNETDGNYLYSGGDEMIGFRDSTVKAGEKNINLSIFREVPLLRFIRGYSEYPGKAVLVFNSATDTSLINWLTDLSKLDIKKITYSDKRDSLSVWYSNLRADTLSFTFQQDTTQDTITLRLFRKQESNKKPAAPFVIIPGSAQSSVQHLHLEYVLQSNHLLSDFHFDSVRVVQDSVPVNVQFTLVDSMHFSFIPVGGWKEKSSYRIFIPPGSFHDIFGNANDTTALSFTTHAEADYGSLTVRFTNAKKMQCILRLTDDARVNIYREAIIRNDTTLIFDHLDPHGYKIKLIYDNNENGKWDTGNYLKGIQPEVTQFYKEFAVIRSNWDVEISLSN